MPATDNLLRAISDQGLFNQAMKNHGKLVWECRTGIRFSALDGSGKTLGFSSDSS